ncbi:HIRA-interacting protein 3 isoform X2 [Denticeps clupeoides]|uniref:HIRA-interacting protein 3 isoform X2 n=1 Tax=Denticeps clupeoides TaxID=299321 RepID=UPI0010A4CE09|nr:HIRA-interacting protein 3 isoform X2 [Denticeps clupeoides]
MVSEETAIRSTLTLGIVRQRYLEHVGRDWLSAESRQLLKRVVEDELLKMQDPEEEDLPLSSLQKAKGSQAKRKREDGNEEEGGGAKAKKSRVAESPPESPDSGIEKVGNEEEKEVPSEEDEDVKEQKTSRRKAKGAVLKEETSEDEEEDLSSADEDAAEVKKRKGAEKKTKKAIPKEETSDDEDLSSADEEGSKQKKKATPAGKKKQNFASAAKRQEGVRKRNSDGDKKPEGEKEDLERSGSGSDGEMGGAGPSDEEEEGGAAATPIAAEDSDSSSLPSLDEGDDTTKAKKEAKEKKNVTKKKQTSGGDKSLAKVAKEENKAVSRLKRYIALCGARRNYKKLLENCRSVKSMVAVLKKELEDLGVEGNPSIEKCKKARLKKEEAQELAELDSNNIIFTPGRPKRRCVSSWPPPPAPPSPPSAYKRTMGSDSDGEGSHAGRGRRRGPDWSGLKGVISDDGDSD